MKNLLKKNVLFVALMILGLTSCRCYTHYEPLPDKPTENLDTTINATARMWQGQYEYLRIDIRVKRTDSLFVKNISVKPSIKNGKYFPVFHKFVMYSYYYEQEGRFKGGPYWREYFADTFDQLPFENRQTNKENLFVKYSADYNSEKEINFENFSADIEVLLLDKSGKTITHKRHINFYGKRECHYSAH